ncbi:MAG TPA: CAP domain-containing protein [Candidatus Binataceae bacterium]|nr:CAP domain-containing protein [Candidatus Binataceae bacterium]
MSQPATLIIIVALLVLAGFSIVRFLVNFDQLESLAEEYRVIGTQARSSTEKSTTEAITRAAEASSILPEPPEVAVWLGPLNHYRAMVGLAPVTANEQLSHGDALHAHYLALNYAAQGSALRLGADAHTEDPAKPGFTPEGASAARTSDIDWIWNPRSWPHARWAISNWMQVPFHRMQIISPYLRRVGYGTDCQDSVCFAALNTGIDLDRPPEIPKAWPRPLTYPPDGSVIDRGEFSAEWPDPLTSCPGYAPPAGLPITLELGHLIVPGFSNYSIKDAENNEVEACAFDANSYVSPDTMAQINTRAILRDFGAIVIVPHKPLSPGQYSVTVTAGQRYSWSFSVRPLSGE